MRISDWSSDVCSSDLPNAEFGESVAAFIQPAHGGAAPSAEDIRHALKGRIADYKIPRAFHFRAQLPRDDSGKIFKRRLREELAREAAASALGRARPPRAGGRSPGVASLNSPTSVPRPSARLCRRLAGRPGGSWVWEEGGGPGRYRE